jgi:hypothetical protein
MTTLPYSVFYPKPYDAYSNLNNLPETTFEAGGEQVLTFTLYDESEIDSLNAVSATWQLCPYGDFKTISVAIEETDIDDPMFTISISPDQTIALSGKYIQQVLVTDEDDNTFITGQGIVIITPSAEN